MFDEYPDVLTVQMCCQALNLGRNSMYNMLKSKEINSIMCGHKYLIPKIYLIDYIESHRETTK